MRRECWERFPGHRLQRKPLISDPGMHHGTCVTHVSWCMSGSLNRGSGQPVSGISGICAPRFFTYLARGPWSCDLDTPHAKQGEKWISKKIKSAWYEINTSKSGSFLKTQDLSLTEVDIIQWCNHQSLEIWNIIAHLTGHVINYPCRDWK